MVILSAVVPTLIAQQFFQPDTPDQQDDVIGGEDADRVQPRTRRPRPRISAIQPPQPPIRPGQESTDSSSKGSREKS